MKRTIPFLLLLSFALMSATNSGLNTPPDEWKFIGDKIVNYGLDRDVIRFGDMNDDFRQIRFHVTNAPLRIFDMKIYFDNGDVQDVALRSVIPQGGDSRIIDLVGGLRHLKKIEFHYKPAARGRKGQSRVAVYGRK